MLQHQLLLILRNFSRFKGTFIINLIGLSSGLACTLLIYLWVNDEMNVDGFHQERLLQVMENGTVSDGIKTQPATPDLLAETMKAELPEIEYAVAMTPYSWFGKFTLTADQKNIKAVGQHVSKDFFNAFTYPLLHGDKNNVLADKNSIVVSKALAIKLFNTTENIIGKTLDCQILGFKDPVIVSGVFEGTPANSSEQFDFVLSFELWKDLSKRVGRKIHWDNHGPYTFVMLQANADVMAFNKKIKGFLKSKDKDSVDDLFAVSFSSRYLHGSYENGVPSGGRIEYVKLFSIIALFILAIACINFMNLSTAKASRRIKEVGIKKAVGASRTALAFQYLGESIAMSFVSLAFSLVLVQLLLPSFNLLTGKQLVLTMTPSLVIPMLAIVLVTGLVSGSYPALYLSGFNPATVLKGKFTTSLGELFMRKGLVVFQFTLSVILIVSVLVVARQIEFVQTRNLGYDKEHIVYFDKEGNVAENQDAFLSEARNIPGVVQISSIATTLTGTNSSTYGLQWEGKDPAAMIQFENVTVNYGMIETLGATLVSGRTYSQAYSADDNTLILNEAAIAVMGLNDPVGKTVNLWGKDKTIIGVVKDFHFESLHERVKPLFFMLRPEHTLKIMARLEGGREKEALLGLEKLYLKFNPGYTMDYKFLDQEYQAQYVAEQRVSILSQYFAGLAIIISCLGLFGLASFTAERRRKEIGIRKVLGSSEFSIVALLSGDFTKIVGIAIVIALPISYFMAARWLDSFAFKIELSLWYFAGAAILALGIAWLTVGAQAIRASRVNPVQSLRSE